VTSPAAFTDADNWTGGFYELAIELGERSDVRIGRALDTLWRADGIDGCYGSREREPHDSEPVPCTVESLERFRPPARPGLEGGRAAGVSVIGYANKPLWW
jgi:hypothetical protein